MLLYLRSKKIIGDLVETRLEDGERGSRDIRRFL